MTLLLLALYAACAVAIALTARWVGCGIPRRPLAVCVALPVLFFSPGLFAGKTPLPLGDFRSPPWGQAAYAGHYNPYLDDVVKQFLPWMAATRLAWEEGSLPLRNRWTGCGSPLFANGSSAAFSPLTVLAWPLTLPAAFLFLACVKLFLALTGMWLWLRELRLSLSAALFGAIAFGFSFSMTPWIFFPHTAVLALWPWALFAIEMLADAEKRRRAFLLLIGVFTMWPLAGHIESVAMGATLTALWLAARLLLRDVPEPRAVVARVGLAAAIALGLSAFFLLPHALAIEASHRRALLERRFWAPLLDGAPHGPRWPSLLLTSFFPRSFGDGIAAPTIANAPAAFPETVLGYFGLTGWAAAMLTLLPGSAPRRKELALGIVLLLGLAGAVLLWPFAEAIDRMPGLRLIVPFRFLSWTAFAGAALAACGVGRLERLLADRRAAARTARIAAIGIAATLSVAALVAHAALREAHVEAGGALSQTRALAAALGTLAGVAAIAGLFPSVRKGRAGLAVPSAAAALTLLCALELFYQGRRLYRFAPVERIGQDGALLAFLRAQPAPFRILGDGYLFYPNTNVLAGVEEVRTHDPLERRDYVAWLDAAAGYSPEAYFKDLRDVNASALDLANVRYFVGRPGRPSPGAKWRPVYAGSDGTVFENTRVVPRVFTGRRSADSRETASIRDYRETTNRVSFRVHAPSGGTHLATSLVDDGGWTMRSEGGAIRRGRASDPFLALELSAGDHAVDLRYAPPGFRTGAALTTATALVLLAAATGSRRARRPPRR